MRPSRRELRGLARILRNLYADGAKPVGRGLVEWMGRLPNGECLWCRTPAPSKRHTWHPSCAKAYVTAKGLTVAMSGNLIPKRNATCERCGSTKSLELDHRIALGIAARIWTPWVAMRAWSRWNLQWLCHGCHAAKTRQDRLAMNALDRGTALPVNQRARRGSAA